MKSNHLRFHIRIGISLKMKGHLKFIRIPSENSKKYQMNLQKFRALFGSETIQVLQ